MRHENALQWRFKHLSAAQWPKDTVWIHIPFCLPFYGEIWVIIWGPDPVWNPVANKKIFAYRLRDLIGSKSLSWGNNNTASRWLGCAADGSLNQSLKNKSILYGASWRYLSQSVPVGSGRLCQAPYGCTAGPSVRTKTGQGRSWGSTQHKGGDVLIETCQIDATRMPHTRGPYQDGAVSADGREGKAANDW